MCSTKDSASLAACTSRYGNLDIWAIYMANDEAGKYPSMISSNGPNEPKLYFPSSSRIHLWYITSNP